MAMYLEWEMRTVDVAVSLIRTFVLLIILLYHIGSMTGS